MEDAPTTHSAVTPPPPATPLAVVPGTRLPHGQQPVDHHGRAIPPLPLFRPKPAVTATPAAPAAAAAVAPTSLDTLESSENFRLAPELSQDASPLNYSQMFIHSGWRSLRNRIHRALTGTCQTASRVKAFNECCNNIEIFQNVEKLEEFGKKCNRCHDRLCLPCAHLKSMKIQEALSRLIADRVPLFITLTLSRCTGDLTPHIDRLYKGFKALRNHPVWTDSIEGGAAFLEVKWNDQANRWHPHLHIIAHGKYISQGHLSQAWQSITNDAYICDVRRPENVDITLRYVTKYASKPFDTSIIYDQEKLMHMVLAIRSRRLCLTFGTWYGTPLTSVEDQEVLDEDWMRDPNRCRRFCGLHEIWHANEAGDPAAAVLLKMLGLSVRPDWTAGAAGVASCRDTS